jgi:hypothetical protein
MPNPSACIASFIASWIGIVALPNKELDHWMRIGLILRKLHVLSYEYIRKLCFRDQTEQIQAFFVDSMKLITEC